MFLFQAYVPIGTKGTIEDISDFVMEFILPAMEKTTIDFSELEKKILASTGRNIKWFNTLTHDTNVFHEYKKKQKDCVEIHN